MTNETIRNLFVSQLKLWRQGWQRLRTHVRRGLSFYLAVIGALLGVYLYDAFTPPPPQLTTRDVDGIVAEAIASVTPAPAYSTLVYQAILPSFVLIKAHDSIPLDNTAPVKFTAPTRPNPLLTNVKLEAVPGYYQGGNGDGGNGDGGNGGGEEAKYGVGSGVVVNDNGDILTALHVVRGAGVIEVTFADGTQSNAAIAAADPAKDIAILQAEQLPELFVPATLGNPNAMQIGDEVYAVGNPLGLSASMSAGVVSGLNRSFQPSYVDQKLEGLIQFDAAVNPGNSGGPLLNRNGQVIGIVTGLINPTTQDVFIGIGLAVPIDVAAGAGGRGPAQ
ncbi:MAG: trypsin-like peptidase domain-containing protein [Caldilineaceae bacterium]